MANNQNPTASGRSRGREIALNVGAIAGLICVLAAAASFLFGIKPLVFRSGSMSPEIPTGALALSKATAAGDLAVGDVVSVLDQQGPRITHRIQEIVSTDGINSVLILKGDANKDADISPYTVTEVDRVFFSVPGLGYAVSWLSSPAAIFIGGALVGGVMVLAFGPASKRKDLGDSDDSGAPGGPGAHERIEQSAAPTFADAPTQQFRAPNTQFRRLLPARTALVLGTVGLTVFGASAVGTSAAFTDSASAASSFASRSTLVPAPKYLGCSGGGGSVTLSWEHLGPGYTYQIQLISGWGGSWNPTPPANKGGTVSINVSAYDNIYETASSSYIEIRSVRNGVTGTSWVGEKLWAFTLWNIKCDGAHVGGGDQSSLVAGGGGDNSTNMRMRSEPAPGAEQVVATTPIETPDPSSTESATPSASPSASPSVSAKTSPSVTPSPSAVTSTPKESEEATPEESTSEEAKPEPTTTTTTTAPPSASTAEEKAPDAAPAQAKPAGTASGTPSDSGTYTAAVDGTTATVTDSSGTEVFTGTVGKGAKTKWAKGSDDLWIVDGDKISVVDAATGKQRPVDISSDTVPAEVAALVAK